MGDVIRIVGPLGTLEIFGVKLVGVNAQNGVKLLASLVLVALAFAMRRVLRALVDAVLVQRERSRFWGRQAVAIVLALVVAIALLSIWFDDPRRLTTGLGLFTAGLAVALQRVVTALAGYLVILRGNTFSVGDRITMGGVRGDVVGLGFIHTTIMEMGEPAPGGAGGDGLMWVRSRQYTGRVVSVTNDKIFDTPVYNYTREFPYIWEEMAVPIGYAADRARAEQIILAAAREHTVQLSRLAEGALADLERRFAMHRADLGPRVYWRLTDNWLELSVRFLVETHGIRDTKDAIAREILAGFDQAGLSVASATFDVVGLPPVRIQPAPAESSAHAP